MTHIVVATQIASATGNPITVTASTQPRQFHRNDHQNVPISQVANVALLDARTRKARSR